MKLSRKQAALAAAAASAAAAAAAAEAYADDPSNPANIPSPALATEMRLLAQRYNKSFVSTQFRSSLSCRFSFAPTDPDFPFALPPEKIVMQLLFHDVSQFPYTPLPEPNGSNEPLRARLSARVEVKVLNSEADIPSYIREVLEKSLHTFIVSTQFGVPALVRNALKMADREVVAWMQLAQKKQNALQEARMRKLLGPAGAAAALAAQVAAGNAAASASPAAPAESAAPAAAPADASASPVSSTLSSLPSLSASPIADDSAVAVAAAVAEVEDEWTSSQQTALESALKTVSKSLAPTERWDAISALVPGKTKKQVLARYKIIREAVKNATVGDVKIAVASSTAAAPSSAASAAPAYSLAHLSNARESLPEEVSSIHAARVAAQRLEREMEALSLREAQLEEDERVLASGKVPKKPKAAAAKPKDQEERKESSESDGSDSDSNDDFDGSGSEDGDSVPAFQATTERLSLNPSHRGTQIVMGELEMTGLGILKASVIRLQVLCVRCETRSDVEFLPSNGVSNPMVQRCGRCGIHHSIKYRPEMVHEHSDSLGFLDLENCEAFDWVPSDLFGTCLECFTEAPIKGWARGQTFDSNCRQCHQRLHARFNQLEFVRITPALLVMEEPKADSRGRKAAEALDPLEVAAAKNRRKEQSLLKLGTALPNKGACKHYKHSHRWMRFPCCGKAYPCDVCHAEAEGHEGVVRSTIAEHTGVLAHRRERETSGGLRPRPLCLTLWLSRWICCVRVCVRVCSGPLA